MDTNPQKHAEVSAHPHLVAGNPVSSSLNIVVSIPDAIEIKMVDASTLNDYELWFFISSILASSVIGFLVALIQAEECNSSICRPLGFMTLVLLILFIVSIATTVCKRRLLNKKGKSINLKATTEEKT